MYIFSFVVAIVLMLLNLGLIATYMLLSYRNKTIKSEKFLVVLGYSCLVIMILMFISFFGYYAGDYEYETNKNVVLFSLILIPLFVALWFADFKTGRAIKSMDEKELLNNGISKDNRGIVIYIIMAMTLITAIIFTLSVDAFAYIVDVLSYQ